jgi:DNA replication protein DnaC
MKHVKYNRDESKEQPWGTVRVAVRVRPLLPEERSSSVGQCMTFSPSDHSEITVAQKSFNFDFAFKPSSSQEFVFETCASSLVDRFLLGYNATILAYGQTGSGKVSTPFGFV